VTTSVAGGGLLGGGHQPLTTVFADAMSTLASSVVFVTCQLGDRPWGMTVTAFASVSADPPIVVVSLGSSGATTRAIMSSRRFGVSILAEDQLAIARYGSARGATKFLEPFTEPDEGLSGSPFVTGALAHLDCELSEHLQIADHTVLFGRVRTARACEGTPLVYHRRGYRRLSNPARAHQPTERNARCLSS
jgi:flavin reductase (DIM6/NTAB) family NADH-FMN oxidoreductase RutF